MTKISDLINNNHLKRAKIAVFGDCMIDEYYKVKVKRISPEAPVPVMLSESDQPSYVIPGGAANVAAQFKHWNVDCTLFGLMTHEDVDIFDKHGIKVAQEEEYLETGCEGVWRRIRHKVPRKKRFVDGQNLVRWDVESNYGVEIENEIDDLISLFEYHLVNHGFDVVIFADYNKGVFKNFDKTHRLINLCREYNVPSIVDPKDEPIEKWCGCTYFKPNSVEAERFTGIRGNDDLQTIDLAHKLYKSGIVVTRGGAGATIFSDGRIGWIHSKNEVPVKNFSGAGDCFVAFFALAISNNFNLKDAAEIAFEAGKVYVQREHNKPLIPLDLYDTKFVHPKDLKNRDFKLVATNGCYDLSVHPGHISTFEFAKSKGDKLVVLINSDESIRNLKGNDRPIVTLADRMRMVAALDSVDYVIPFNEDSPVNMIREIRPDALVKGEDWREKGVRGAEIVKEVHFAPIVPGLSTTNLIKKIRGNHA